MPAVIMSHFISMPHEIEDQRRYSLSNPLQGIIDEKFSDSETFSYDDFNILGVLGVGSFGVVRAAYHKRTKINYAIKFVQKNASLENQDSLESLCNEILLLHSFKDTEYLCNCKGVIETDEEYGILMPLYAGGELFSYICDDEHLPYHCRIFIAAEILVGIEELHDRGFLYRDLKAENIVIANDLTIRLIDFGFAKKLKSIDDRTLTMVGTPDYTAPEIIKREEYSYPADMWSFGVLLFELYCKTPPFNLADFPDSITEKYEQILNGQLAFPCGCSSSFVDLCSKILNPDPEKRLSVKQIKAHPFFQSINWDDISKKNIPSDYLPNIDIDLDLPCTNFDPYEEGQEELFDDYFDDYYQQNIGRMNSDDPPPTY